MENYITGNKSSSMLAGQKVKSLNVQATITKPSAKKKKIKKITDKNRDEAQHKPVKIRIKRFLDQPNETKEAMG